MEKTAKNRVYLIALSVLLIAAVIGIFVINGQKSQAGLDLTAAKSELAAVQAQLTQAKSDGQSLQEKLTQADGQVQAAQERPRRKA